MTMIETVRQRQKNSTDFASCYDNLCALQNSCPLGSITANLDELTIDCNADRIRHADWTPLLNALKINKTLKILAFRSYWQQTLYPDGGRFIDPMYRVSQIFLHIQLSIKLGGRTEYKLHVLAAYFPAWAINKIDNR